MTDEPLPLSGDADAQPPLRPAELCKVPTCSAIAPCPVHPKKSLGVHQRTEAEYTRRVLKALRLRFPEAWIRKLNDQSTGGIPDAVLIHRGFTWWVEFKRIASPHASVGVQLSALQHATMRVLRRAKAFTLLVGFCPDGTQILEDPISGARYDTPSLEDFLTKGSSRWW
jgi:hypothetical protein